MTQLDNSNNFIIKDDKSNVEKLVNIQIFSKKIIANLSAGFGYNYESYYKIYGTRGVIELKKCFSIEENKKNIIYLYQNDKVKKIQIKPHNQFSLMISNFIKIIHNNKISKDNNNKNLNYIYIFDKIFKK